MAYAGIFYYYKIEYVLDELIKIDSKEVAQLDHNEYIQMIQNILEKKLGYREDSMCIIMPKQCAKILGIKNYSQIVRGDEELAYFYTKEETREICTLAKQMEKAQCQMPAYGWQQYYIGIKQKIEYFWNRDEDSILCSKLLIAFRGIQSDPYNKWEFDRNGNIVRKRDEDSINNLVAFFLKAYYGEENIHYYYGKNS